VYSGKRKHHFAPVAGKRSRLLSYLGKATLSQGSGGDLAWPDGIHIGVTETVASVPARF